MFARQTLGEQEVDAYDVTSCEGGSENEWRSRRNPAQQTPDCRAANEPQSESSPDQAHTARPFFWGRYVRYIRLRGRNVPARDTVNDPSHKEQPQAAGQTHDQESNRAPNYAEKKHRPAADPVRQLAEDRSE